LTPALIPPVAARCPWTPAAGRHPSRHASVCIIPPIFSPMQLRSARRVGIVNGLADKVAARLTSAQHVLQAPKPAHQNHNLHVNATLTNHARAEPGPCSRLRPSSSSMSFQNQNKPNNHEHAPRHTPSPNTLLLAYNVGVVRAGPGGPSPGSGEFAPSGSPRRRTDADLTPEAGCVDRGSLSSKTTNLRGHSAGSFVCAVCRRPAQRRLVVKLTTAQRCLRTGPPLACEETRTIIVARYKRKMTA